MRVSTIAQLLLSGAVTVSSLALPDNHDYSNDDVCHVSTVIVKLTPLDQYVGHTFPLLSPEAAMSAQSNSETCLPTATSYNPVAAATTPAASVGYATSTAPAVYSTYVVSGNTYTTSVAPTTYYAPSAPSVYSTYVVSGSTYTTQLAASSYAPSTTPAAYSSTPAVSSTYVVSGSTYTTLAATTYPASTAPVYSTYTVSGTPYTTIEAYTTYAASTTSMYTTYVASATTYTTVVSSSTYSTSATDTTSDSGETTTSTTASSGTTSTTSSASSSTSTTMTTTTMSSTTTTSTTSSATSTGTQCSNPSMRVEWRNMQDTDKAAYVKAERCLFDSPSKGTVPGATNRHEDLQGLHQQLSGTIHGVAQFLAWHRNFLHAHEVLLRTECSYNGPMPWWDETKDTGNFSQAPFFTSEYFGTAAEATSNGMATCVTDGAFADIELNIGPGMSDSRHCLARAVNEGLAGAVTQNFISTCNSYTDFASMQNCVFPGPHAYTHDAVGAVMSDVASSPGDPVFFMHHGFIDRNYMQWQAANPTRLYEISGYTTQSEPSGGWVNISLDYVLSTMGVVPDVPLRQAMDTRGGYLCYTYDY